MSNVLKKPIKYDLEERTRIFGEEIIKFAQKVPRNAVTLPLISQVVRSGTSVGANYCEADDAVSRADFKHKIGLCKKEARETKHWLKMIITAYPDVKDKTERLLQEVQELVLIFNAIIKSTNQNKSNKN